MAIPDAEKINEKLKATGRRLTPWARARGFNIATVWQVVHNEYPYPQSKTAVAICEALREDGMWAEKAA